MSTELDKQELLWGIKGAMEAVLMEPRKFTKGDLLDLIDLWNMHLFLCLADDQVELGPLDLDDALDVPTRLSGSHRFRRRLGRN